MATPQHGSLPSNPLLGPHDEADMVSMNSIVRNNSQLLSQLSTNDRSPEKPSHQRAAGHHRRTATKKNVFKLWWNELLSIVFSLLCLAANVGVLASLDHKPYESWRIARVDVTPNTIISIIATFTKASLLLPVAEVVVQLKWLYFQARMQRVSDLQVFDDASRGPLGSMRLLWRVNLRSSVASLGALITILALATEPFTQQVLRYPTRQSLATNVTAAISTTNVVDSTDFGNTQDDGTLAETAYLQQLYVAINSGISSPAADALYNCPSGSCTWPPFLSLALCNSCQDISNYTEISCSSDPKMGTGYRLCTYSLGPALTSIINGDGPPLIAWNLWMQADDVTYNPNTWMNISQDYTDAFDAPGMATWVDIVRFNGSYVSTSPKAPDDILPTILRCKFTWCAQYHSTTSVYNGTLSDVPEFSVPLVQDESSDVYVPDGDYIPQDESQQIEQMNEQFQIDSDFSKLFQDLLASVLQNEVFNTTHQLLYLTDVLDQLPSSYLSDYVAAADDQVNQGRSYSVYYGNNGDVSETLDNIAVSVTNQLRSGLASTNVTGTVMYPIVYIEVIWPWFIYPIALTVSAAALLAVTIWLSCGYDKMVWKSSSLALIFHGIPDEEADGRLLGTAAMETAADEMWAKLSEDEVGNVRLKTL